jgi:hypothetical protein
VIAARAHMAADQAEDAQEEETVGNEKIIIKIRHPQKFPADKESNNAGQHEERPENARSPTKIIDDSSHFHNVRFWVKQSNVIIFSGKFGNDFFSF